MIRIGLDVGSTTVKCVVLDEHNQIIYSSYERHYSQIAEKVHNMLVEIKKHLSSTAKVSVNVSGSAGMGFATEMGIPFVQEVYATRLAVKTLLPDVDTVIELGGEDAKILFLSGTMEVRMNGSCAGGTGAFIDRMAALLDVAPLDMNEYAKDSRKIYTIASRCGVFAKSDVQPLLNQGARKEDVAASIYAAVVNQTIAGLAQGRKIEGNVLYLGGPLTFFSELRKQFDKILKLEGIFPENSLYYVAIGTALSKEEKEFDLEELIVQMGSYESTGEYSSCDALFANRAEYNEFVVRHHIGEAIQVAPLQGKAYIGIDAGSTTLKAVLMGEDEQIVHYKYMQNGGSPVPLVKEFLEEVYENYPAIEIAGVATTGYGEEIIKNAFHADLGVVETMAHFTAAKKYEPCVDFIIDIGGQDIKCFQIRNGSIDNIFLNEACSSGCGSFLQSFATALGENIEHFSEQGLFASNPVDLGSRCTVFMNSSVKQAQKDGAGLDNISAGLSVSVVKNALYKVIRITNTDQLGQHIVVQGGTFLNNAVLRAFEKEVGRNVTRPQIAGLMGAYGAALYCREHNKNQVSSILSKEELAKFTHEVKAVTCHSCTNHCKLTVNTFDDGRKFIGGNRCEKPLALKEVKEKYNLYDVKKKMLAQYGNYEGERETIGIPMGLNMFEMIPFWHKFFTSMGFGIILTKESTREVYMKGQHTIPSDTVCYPAKLIHGHIVELLESKVDAIFYPCMTYNFDEGNSDNHYNCPVVAYYSEVIKSNNKALESVPYIGEYIGVHRKKDFPHKMYEILSKYFEHLTMKEVVKAAKEAYIEYSYFMEQIRCKGKEYLQIAEEKDLPVIVLAGRPYHLGSEISHGIDQLICEHGAVLVTEDAVSDLSGQVETNVLSQWTYHARLFAAADYVASRTDQRVNLVQLVSFGCGIDAITTDEVRKKLEDQKKIYTLIKIDEISNLGAVKIRLRSLFAVIGQEKIDV